MTVAELITVLQGLDPAAQAVTVNGWELEGLMGARASSGIKDEIHGEPGGVTLGRGVGDGPLVVLY